MSSNGCTGFIDADAENVTESLTKAKEGWGGTASARGKGIFVTAEVEPQFGSSKAVSSYLARQLAYLWYKEVHPNDELAETLAPQLEDEDDPV